MSNYEWSSDYEKDLEYLRKKKEDEICSLQNQIEGINIALALLMRRTKVVKNDNTP